MNKKTNTTFRVEDKLWKDFNLACQINGRTRGEVLREFMADYAEKELENVKFYDSLWEYVKTADISDYVYTGERYQGDKEIIIWQIDILEDPDLYMGGYDESIVEKDGKLYKLINWGEDEKSYVLESEFESGWSNFWTVGHYTNISEKTKIADVKSYGEIFRSKKEALEAVDERYFDVEEEQILVKEEV